MDPISILTTVSAVSRTALALSSTLYSFVQATKGVDGTVRALYDEVTGLNFTLDAIIGIVRSAEIGKTQDNEQTLKLWSTVTKSLAGCRETVDKLHETLRGLDRESSSIARQAIRTFKLNWKTDQINALRSHLHSHNSTLQLSMQILNVHFISISPRLVIDDLVPRIEILMDMVLQYSEAHREPAASVQPQDGVKRSPISGTSNADNIVASAREVLFEAKSVVARSEAGSVYHSTAASVIQRLEDLEHDFDDNITTIRGNVPVRRDSWMETDPHLRIKNWIPTIPLRRLDGTNSPETESSYAPTQMTPSESTFEMLADKAETVLLDFGDSDDDNEIDNILLEAFLSKALVAYKSGDWAVAEPFLQRTLDDSTTLPARKLVSAGIDLTQVEFRLVICKLQQDKIDETAPRLARLITAKGPLGEGKPIAMQRLVLIYLYAEVCFCKEKTEEARKYCRKALSLKRKLFGNEVRFLDHNAFDLLSRIAQIQGDDLAADLFFGKSKEACAMQKIEEESYPELQIAQLDKILLLKSRLSLGTKNDTRLEKTPKNDARLKNPPKNDARLKNPPKNDACLENPPKNFVKVTTLSEWSASTTSLPIGTFYAVLSLHAGIIVDANSELSQLLKEFSNISKKFPDTRFIYYSFHTGGPPTLQLRRKDNGNGGPAVLHISKQNGPWNCDGHPMNRLFEALQKYGCT